MNLYDGKLKNGIKYIISNNNCGSSVTIIIFIKVGSRNESKNLYGISHFIEHMFFKGTNKYSSPSNITNALYKYGAKINAYTDKDNTGYYVKIDANYIEKALDILSEILFHSKFMNNDIILEKNVVINELERSKSDPNRSIDNLISSLVFDNTSLSHDIGGENKIIKNYNKNMVMKYINKYYCCENILISISGNIKNINKLIKNLEISFGNKKFNYNNDNNENNNINYNKILFNKIIEPKFYKNFINKQNNIRIKNIINHNIHQTYISIAVPTYNINDDKSFIVDIIGAILAGNMSSRLFIKLREKRGLIYSVKYSHNKYEDIGALKIYFSTFNENNKIKECCKLTINEFENLKKNLITDGELDNIKKYLIGNYQLSKEDTINTALFHGYNKLIGGNTISYEKYYDKYNKITKENIKKISNEIFNINKLNIAIISNNKII